MYSVNKNFLFLCLVCPSSIYLFICLLSRHLTKRLLWPSCSAGQGAFLTTGALILFKQLRKSELDVRIKTLGTKVPKTEEKARFSCVCFSDSWRPGGLLSFSIHLLEAKGQKRMDLLPLSLCCPVQYPLTTCQQILNISVISSQKVLLISDVLGSVRVGSLVDQQF